MMIVFPLVYTNKPVISNIKIIVKDTAHLSDFSKLRFEHGVLVIVLSINPRSLSALKLKLSGV